MARRTSAPDARTASDAHGVIGAEAASDPGAIREIPVERIRPEEGLGRKRDRDGHRDLRNSIQQFGVLTPITVRPAPDDSGDYLLIKGQGRTLACRMLGLERIPAIIVDEAYAENEKVQQFLVENVARLRMRPIDRALLIARARKDGEETTEVARRFSLTPATVRRLQAQLDGASKAEVAALKQGKVNLALHAVVSRFIEAGERGDVVQVLNSYSLRPKELEAILTAVGWRALTALGSEHRADRILLFGWACATFTQLTGGTKDRISQLAELLPLDLTDGAILPAAVAP